MCKTCLERPGCAWYRIHAGESLSDIAARHATTCLRLMELNPYLDPAELVEGMPLFVPADARFAHAHYGAALAGTNLLPGQRLPVQ